MNTPDAVVVGSAIARGSWDDHGVRIRAVAVGDVELAVAEAGQGGRPLLLLHGFTGAKEDFTEWLDRLAEGGWHAVAPDHRGHGSSSKPETEDAYSLALLASDALALADALGWSHFAVLGHSMGGFVAQLVAIRAADRLDGLVLMDTGHGALRDIDPTQANMAVRLVRDSGIDTLADVLAGQESPLDTPAHRRLMAERPGYREFGDGKLRATSRHLYAALLPGFLDADDRLEALRRLPGSLPALVIVGDQDTPFLESSRRMADAIRGAVLEVIPDAGHSPQFENPEAWWNALSAFLDRVETS